MQLEKIIKYREIRKLLNEFYNVKNYRGIKLIQNLKMKKKTATMGEIRLCQFKSTRQSIVFRPFVSYISTYRTRFADSSSFMFTTEK